MPLISVCIGNPSGEHSFSVLMQKFPGTDYAKMGAILNGMVRSFTPKGSSLTLEKSTVRILLSIAQSDRERECVRYAVYKASGMTPTAVRRAYGFERMPERAALVEASISEIEQIRLAIDDLARVEDRCLLARLGIQADDSSSDEDEEEDTLSLDNSATDHSAELVSVDRQQHEMVDPAERKLLIEKCKYNWFELMELLQQQNDSVDARDLFSEVSSLDFDALSVHLIEQSYHAYLSGLADTHDQDCTARAVNGEIVSESESDCPESYVGMTDPFCEAGKALIVKQRAAIRRKAKIQKVKAIAERRFLSRKVSRRVSHILTECPDIGNTIETFVRDRNIGADAWRHIYRCFDIKNFDGNVKLKEKVTYEKIRQHLLQVYKRKFTYGTSYDTPTVILPSPSFWK